MTRSARALPPLEKGATGDLLLAQKANPPRSPFYKGGGLHQRIRQSRDAFAAALPGGAASPAVQSDDIRMGQIIGFHLTHARDHAAVVAEQADLRVQCEGTDIQVDRADQGDFV